MLKSELNLVKVNLIFGQFFSDPASLHIA